MKRKTKKKSLRSRAKRVVKITRRPRVVKRKPVKAKRKAPARKNVSYGVKFVRRKPLSEIRGPNGWVRSPGSTRQSDRRFATRKEAEQHGKRFTKIEKHKSFSVFASTGKVNASINWRTGKTNPVIGLGRRR